MKKFICVILSLFLSFNGVLAEEVARLYLVQNADCKNVRTTFNPAFNKLGYNLIDDKEYIIYENPQLNTFNIIILKNSGQDCYYYYLSNEGSAFNKTLLTGLDNYRYEYKRIKNTAFLDLFYNDAQYYFSQSRSAIRTVSRNTVKQTSEEYDFSDEAQENFDNRGQMGQNAQSPQSITSSDVLIGSLVHMEAGTQFDAVLSSGISSESISNNDLVSAQLMQDWIFNGILIAPAGSILNGNVIDSKPASFAMGNGRIGIDFNQLITPDGKIIYLSSNKVYIVGDSSRAKNIAGRVAGGIASGVAIAALAMLFGADAKSMIGGAAVGGALGTISAIGSKGEDIDVPEGSALQIILAEPMTIQPYTYNNSI